MKTIMLELPFNLRLAAALSLLQLKVVEEEVSRLEAALSARETALRGSDHETEAQRSKIANLQSALQTKEKIIEAMQVRLRSVSVEWFCFCNDFLFFVVLHCNANINHCGAFGGSASPNFCPTKFCNTQ